MMKINEKINLLLFLMVFVCCNKKEELFIEYTNPEIKYSGRIDLSEGKDGVDFYWSGTSVKFSFEGESIEALIEDEHADNYFNVIIDDRDPIVFKLDSTKQYYSLASNLSKGKHSIEIFKRTEWDRGKTTFYGFRLKGDVQVLPRTVDTNRKMEFYGNSITAGYAIDDVSGDDSSDSEYINNYLSYAAITARHFDAEYRSICKSGIGLTVSWFPLIMPEMYDRLIPTDPKSKWDFSLYKPDIVVINLLQNDSWIINLPESDEFKYRFEADKPDDQYIIEAYEKFVLNIRNHYPEAQIICTLGCMDASKEDSHWRSYVEQAVENINDKAIYTYFMPYIEATAHPSIEDHEVMAAHLIEFIESNINW